MSARIGADKKSCSKTDNNNDYIIKLEFWAEEMASAITELTEEIKKIPNWENGFNHSEEIIETIKDTEVILHCYNKLKKNI